MRSQIKYHRQRPKNFSQEEKRHYCLQWERSGQSKAAFCQSQQITKSAFYAWYHQFKQSNPIEETIFSPVTLKAASTIASENIMQLEICLPNQTKILFPIQKSHVISFIQELCHATTAIR